MNIRVKSEKMLLWSEGIVTLTAHTISQKDCREIYNIPLFAQRTSRAFHWVQKLPGGRKLPIWAFYFDMHEAMGCKPACKEPTILPSHPDSNPSDPQTPSEPVFLLSTSGIASTSLPEPPTLDYTEVIKVDLR